MALKRKRADDSSPLSASSFGSIATPDTPSPTHFPLRHDSPVNADHRSSSWTFSSAGRQKSGADWGLRTRKRVRDNRPDECTIHENTFTKLFSAQRQHPHAEPIMSDAVPTSLHHLASSIAHQKPQKSTLHAFWNLPRPPVQSSSFVLQDQASPGPRCDDCDAPLRSEEAGMDVDMDGDDSMGRNAFSCSSCGRHVCGTCAVVTDVRHCLQCATPTGGSRRWW